MICVPMEYTQSGWGGKNGMGSPGGGVLGIEEDGEEAPDEAESGGVLSPASPGRSGSTGVVRLISR